MPTMTAHAAYTGHTVTVDPAGTVHVVLRGNLDVPTRRQVKDAALAAIDAGATDVVVDCSESAYIDSSGWGVLVRVTKRLRERHGRWATLVGVNEDARAQLEVTHLDTLFTLASLPPERAS